MESLKIIFLLGRIATIPSANVSCRFAYLQFLLSVEIV